MKDLSGLEAAFANAKDARLAGELAYVIAVKAHRDGQVVKSQLYAKKCVKIFEEIDEDIETLDDAAPILNVVDGVVLPEYIHLAVVKERFQEMGISY